MSEHDKNENGSGVHFLRTDQLPKELVQHMLKDVLGEEETMEWKIMALNELGMELFHYKEFLDDNREPIEKLLSGIPEGFSTRKGNRSLNYTYPEVETFFAFDQAIEKNIKKLRAINDFFQSANWKTEFFSLEMEMLEHKATSMKKMMILERDINNLREQVGNLFESIIDLVNSIPHLKQSALQIGGHIRGSYIEEYDTMFFGKVKTGNVNYKHRDNLLLTAFYNNIFDHIPIKKEDATTHGYTQKMDSFSEDIVALRNIEVSQEILSGRMIAKNSYNQFHELMGLYQTLLVTHRDVEIGIQTVLSKRDPRRIGERFVDTKRIEKQFEDIEEALGTNAPKMLGLLDEIYTGNILENIKIEKMQVGSPKLIGIKKWIFAKFDTLFSDSLTDDARKKMLEEISKKKTEYEQLKKELGKSSTEGGKLTNHYAYNIGNLGLIEGYAPHAVAKPAKVVGETAGLVKTKIRQVMDMNDGFGHIYQTYPGIDNSLAGNLLILGPYGYGKTAVIRELAADESIITMQVKYSDISTAYYGHEDKNAEAIFQQAQLLGEEKNKDVFVFIDEFDRFFSHGDGMMGNRRNLGVQTTFQTGMDGIDAFDKVHIIGLSNKPHLFPMDIVRRMEVMVMQPLSLAEKVELIYSRLARFPKETAFEQFLEQLKSDTIGDLTLSGIDKEELLKHFKDATPKMIAGVSEKTFFAFNEKIKSIDPTKLKKLNQKMGRMNKSKMSKDEHYRQEYATTGHQIMTQDFASAISELFANPATQREIDVNNNFYKKVEELIANIQGTSYNT